MTKRSREMKRSRKVLLSMGVLAVVGALAGAGTFASFFAQTTNAGNVFADGTLVLSDTVDTGTACLSTAGGTTDVNSSSAGCDKSFNVSVAKPGDAATTTLTIENMGSLAAASLKVFSSTCTPADAAGENYHGTGNPCGQVQIYIQQWTSGTFGTVSTCLYGGTTVANTCDFSDTSKTLTAFATAHGILANGIGAGALAAAGGADTRWFTIGVKLPSTADNTYQGRSATMDLSWHAVQV